MRAGAATNLIERLRSLLGDEGAASFQLMGEELALLTGADLEEAALAYRAELERTVPAGLRPAFLREQRALQERAVRWLRRYNRNVTTRLRGYLALGRACHFEYPWPVVAILGICTVQDGMGRMRVYGLVGQAAERLGLPLVARITDRLDDVLRRTNRGIFADSVPVALLALRCHALRAAGQDDLARALLAGPLPLTMDEECRELARDLCEGLALPDGQERFARLAALTTRHFGREQAVFTHHLGERRTAAPPPFASPVEAFISNPRAVLAPAIERGWRGRRVVFRPRRLPAGFDIRGHAGRVEVFGELFVRSLTRDRADYQAAVDFALARCGEPGERHPVRYAPGPTPPPARWEE